MLRLAIFVTVAALLLLTAWGAAATLEVDGGAAGYQVIETPPPPTQVEGVNAEPQGGVTAVGRFSLSIGEAIQVSWIENDEDEGVTEYRIYRAEDYSGDFEQVGTSGGPSYTDYAVDAGETYVYYVTAVNDVGESVPSDEASAEVPVDCDALKGSDAYNDAVADGDCPELTPTPTPTAEGVIEAFEAQALEAGTAPQSTSTPPPTPTSTPFTNPTPGSATPLSGTPSATQTPFPTIEPSATSTPEPAQTTEPTQEPTATDPPANTPEPGPTDTAP